MPRGYRNLQVSFAGGEMSPEMWSRHDDARFRSGAARMLNMVAHSRGSVSRRPGFALVREVKDSTRKVRLLPFRFSLDQTTVIEMGRATVESLDRGYFRFHTDGGTLLHTPPRDYVETQGVVSLDVPTDDFTLSSAHGFETGDPVVLTMEPHASWTATFNDTNDQVTRALHGFQNGDSVLFRTTGSLPPELSPGRIYYVVNAAASTFQLARKRSGQVIDLTTTGSGTHTVACLPVPQLNGTDYDIDVNKTYYAIDVTATKIKLAASRSDALANVRLNFQSGRIGSFGISGAVRVHYDYRNGDVVKRIAVAGPPVVQSPYYCRKAPWGTPNALQVNFNDHQDHAPESYPHYWLRQSGSLSLVSFSTGTDRVNWLDTVHGLSEGDPVVITTTGSLVTGLTPGVTYYVRNPTANDFQLAESPVGGPVIDLTGSGSGNHTAFANTFYEVPHYYDESDLFEVNYTQSNDVLTLVHGNRPVAELKRFGATYWVLADVAFNAGVSAPSGVEVETFGGEGVRPTSLTAAPTSVITCSSDHLLAPGEPVMVRNLADIPDGHYIVLSTPAGAPTTLTLKDFETGNPRGSAGGSVSGSARIRPSPYASDWAETYAVTALDEGDNESVASSKVAVSNNLLVSGATNTISWLPVSGAKRYRVYKEVNGLLGFIGEVDDPTVTFLDDNIAPDLSITPPLLDSNLRKSSIVTFDLTADTVLWADHGLSAGAPVVFETDGDLPTGLEVGSTYYVVNPSEDAFQLSEPGVPLVNLSGLADPADVHVAASGLFPSAVAYFEQRRVFGGPFLAPQDFWMTASSTESGLRYHIPTQDTDRIYNRLAARERSQIRHMVPVGHLLLLTSSSEYRLTPLDSDALTPGSVSARAPTQVGTSAVAPVVVNNALLFPAARGGHLREMGFLDRVGDYVTGDLSLRAAHLFDGRTLVQMAYQQAPHPVVWIVSSTGSLLGLSYIPEEQIAGWHEHTTAGTFESVVSVAEGDEDHVYVVVKRGSSRYVERMGLQEVAAIEDVFYVDAGVTYSGSPVSSLSVPHLASASVAYLADGVVGYGTVSAGGTLTLPTAASTIHVGRAYTSELRTLPVGLQVDAALGSGRTKNINQVFVRVYNSGAFSAGPDPTALSKAQDPTSGALFTGLVQVTVAGAWDYEGQVYIQQTDPLPLTVAGLTLEIATGG